MRSYFNCVCVGTHPQSCLRERICFYSFPPERRSLSDGSVLGCHGLRVTSESRRAWQSALCSSPSCLREPEAPVDFIMQPAVGSLPCGVCSPQHIHGDPYWDDPSLQGGGGRLHGALCFEVTRHLPCRSSGYFGSQLAGALWVGRKM